MRSWGGVALCLLIFFPVHVLLVMAGLAGGVYGVIRGVRWAMAVKRVQRQREEEDGQGGDDMEEEEEEEEEEIDFGVDGDIYELHVGSETDLECEAYSEAYSEVGAEAESGNCDLVALVLYSHRRPS